MSQSVLNTFGAIAFAFTILASPTFTARILGVVPIVSYSHQVAFQPIWRELSLRGHQVTVITSDPMKDPSLINLTEIDVNFMYDDYTKKIDKNKFADYNVFEMTNLMLEVGSNMIDKELQHPEVQNLIKNEKEHFDVVLVETIIFGMVAFAERFKCPLIQILSVDAPIINHYMIGNPAHPVLNPELMLSFSGELSFFERLTSTAYYCYTLLFNKYRLFPSQDMLIQKHFGKNIPPIQDILMNTSLMFVNTDFVFHPIRPLQPNVIQIGGGTHLKKPKQLPKNLQKVLDGAKDGFIYFSLGSNVRSSDLPEDVRTVFLETFAELPYTILWKFETEDLPGKPDNVHISKWFPQQDIFKHPNIKLFISQGGLQSMDEAVHNYVPIVGIPFMGDQDHNVRRMVEKGIGLRLTVDTIDNPSLKTTILEVINNPRYRERVKQLAQLAKDQPMTGLERAVWWTEYVIRHKGANHLRNPVLDLPDYQYYLLDVIGFCFLILVVVLYILAKLVKLVCKFVKYFITKPKIKVQ